jgi:spermidine synthase
VGLGGITYTLVSPRRLVSLSGLALTFGLEALCLGFPLALGDRVAMLALTLRRLADAGFLANTLGWCAISGLVILPTALVAGFQFALLLALLGRGRERVGRQVGLAYAWNTIGAMAGSLAGGFGLLPVLSAPGVWRGTVLLLALVSLAAAMVDWVGGTRSAGAWAGGVRRAQLGLASVAVVSLALLGAQGPTAAWRHSSIGVGRADQFSRAPAVERRDQVHYWRRVLLWERDGVESSVALTAEKGISFLVNGKNDGNARFDAGTSAMSGLIGALLHPEPKRAFIVGLGTGTTAGWLAAVPSVQQVDVAELEPTMMRVAQACELVNHAALRNPRIRVAFGDARELLAVARGGYDLVISEPSNPYRAGVASLFTREFYASAAGKLSERGLFLQWVQAYEVDQPTVRAACATLASVFPVVEAWETQASDLLFVATSRPLDYDVASLRARVAQEPFRSALRRIWRMSDLEGFLAHYLSSNTLSRDLARQPGLRLNTDDRTIMEFSFGRAVGQRRPFDTRHWLADSQARQTDRPPVRNGTVDWRAVEDRRHSMFVLEGLEPPPTAATPAQEHRVRAKTRFVNGDFHGALTAWRAQTDSPADRTELLLVAQSLADAGNPEASAYLEPLRSEAPGEAEVLTAHLLWRQGRLTEATAALASAFVRYRSDPWPLPLLMHRALGIAQTITQQSQDRALARRLHTVLGEPFAVRLWDQARLACRFNLALDSADPALLGEAIAAFEPQVPWRRYFLEKRLACYTLLGDPRARRAERDWQTYLASAPPEQDQPRGPLPGGR